MSDDFEDEEMFEPDEEENKKSDYNSFFNNITEEDEEEDEEASNEEDEENSEFLNEDNDDDDLPQEDVRAQPKNRKKRLSQVERQKKMIQELKNELAEKNNLLNTEVQRSSSYELELFNKTFNEIEKEEEYWSQIQDGCKSGLRIAHEDGESDSVAEFTSKLQDSKLALDKLNQRKREIQNLYNNYSVSKQNVSHSSSNSRSVNPDLDDFLERNPFLNLDDTKNYSPAAAAVVNELSSKLTQEYKLNGRGDEVQSEEYFRELEDIMKNRFNNEKRNSGEERVRSSRVRSVRSPRMVAPVGKRDTFSSAPSSRQFSSQDKKQMIALRNIFGEQYDDLLVDTFSKARNRRP